MAYLLKQLDLIPFKIETGILTANEAMLVIKYISTCLINDYCKTL